MIFKNPLDNFFIFFQIKDVLPRLTLEKEANRWKIAKKMVIFAIVCCHGNSLQYTHMNENGIPGVLLIFTVSARSLNPKLQHILHFKFVILFQV